MYSQKNCMTKTKSDIKKVTINGPIKLRMMSMSSFLTNGYIYTCKPTNFIALQTARDRYSGVNVVKCLFIFKCKIAKMAGGKI